MDSQVLERLACDTQLVRLTVGWLHMDIISRQHDSSLPADVETGGAVCRSANCTHRRSIVEAKEFDNDLV